MKRVLMAFAALAACAASSASSYAAPRDPQRAQALFDEGLAAYDAGDKVRACEKFEQSMRLDPANGTLINIARCQEERGEHASARATYEEVAELAAREGQLERAAVASAAAKRLETLTALDAGVREQASLPARAEPERREDAGHALAYSGAAFGAIGVASLVAGGILGALSRPNDRDPFLASSDARADASAALLATGAILAAGGIVMIVVDLGADRGDARRAARIAPVVGTEATGLSLTLAF